MSKKIENLDLFALSADELKALAAKVEAASIELAKQKRLEVKAKIEAILTDANLTLADVFDITGPIASMPASPGKLLHVNPANPAQTWSGRGRRPQWFIELTAGKGKPRSKKAPAKKRRAKKPRS